MTLNSVNHQTNQPEARAAINALNKTTNNEVARKSVRLPYSSNNINTITSSTHTNGVQQQTNNINSTIGPDYQYQMSKSVGSTTTMNNKSSNTNSTSATPTTNRGQCGNIKSPSLSSRYNLSPSSGNKSSRSFKSPSSPNSTLNRASTLSPSMATTSVNKKKSSKTTTTIRRLETNSNSSTSSTSTNDDEYEEEDPEEYESADETPINERISTPSSITSNTPNTNTITSLNGKNNSLVINKPQSQTTEQLKSPAIHSNNNDTTQTTIVGFQTCKQSQSLRASPLASTSSTLTNINNNNSISNNINDNGDHNKTRRPNFIVINKSGANNKIINSSGPKSSDNKLRQEQQVHSLARGAKQRASISSCSSSDSYGSGYASGSGNSTDHELREKRKNNNNSATSTSTSTTTTLLLAGATVLDSTKTALLSDGDEQQQQKQLDAMASKENKDTNDEVGHNETKLERTNPLPSMTKPSMNESNMVKITTMTSSTSGQKLAPNSDIDKFYEHPNKVKNSTTSTTKSTTSTNGDHEEENQNDDDDNDDIMKEDRNNDHRIDEKNGREKADYDDDVDHKRIEETKTSSPQNSNIRLQTPTTPSLSLSHNNKSSGSNNTSIKLSNNIIRTNPIDQQQQQQQQCNNNEKQEPYYHTLFQWEQLVSEGVTRPLLINDLDFTDLRDEDDCDLLNSNQNQAATGPLLRQGRNHGTGEPLQIKIPSQIRDGQDQIDSGTSSGPNSGSPTNRGAGNMTPATAPPPLPPPPMSPWFNTYSGSRPQSQLLLSPTPSFDTASQVANSSNDGFFNREESPVDSTYSNYSRNSYCAPHTSTPTQELLNAKANLNRSHQFNNIQQQASSLRSASSMSSLLFGSNGKYGNKRKKTMKLFWKEVREDRSLLNKLTKKKTIWDEIKPVPVDTQKLEYLFESKAKDLSLSKSRNGLDGLNQRKAKITVLDTKRSNAINIGMTKLPPMRTIKSAILKMDSNIMNREGIEKILTTMMPTEEEKSRIIEAQLANPETPLGTAEQFLLNLASISALEARLKLWAFQLDYAQIEKEVAEPLMDLKQAIEEIEQSETFRLILGTLLSIGNFLNCSNVKGFQIDYLEKVPEVKDTVHKHSLLHHLCVFMQERYPHTGNLYSEFSAVNRASKIDFVEVGKNLKKMQQDCKASWDYLKIVAKHDGLANLMNTSSNLTSNLVSSPSAAGGGSSSIASGGGCLGTIKSSSSPTPNHVGGGTKPSCGKLNNLSKLSMITTITSSENNSSEQQTLNNQQQKVNHQQYNNGNPSSTITHSGPSNSSSSNSSHQISSSSSGKQTKTKVSDFLTDCAERIMVLMVIHRRVMNRFQKLLVYLGCPSHQIKQTLPHQLLKVINEFALEYRTKRERVCEMILKRQQCKQNHRHHYLNHHSGISRWQLERSRWASSLQLLDNNNTNNRPCSTASSYANNNTACVDLGCCDTMLRNLQITNGQRSNQRASGQWTDSLSGSFSNYSDYLYDQASNCSQSRQQSVTPVPHSLDKRGSQQNIMSVSMYDLQHGQSSQPVNNRTPHLGSVSYHENHNHDLTLDGDNHVRGNNNLGKRLSHGNGSSTNNGNVASNATTNQAEEDERIQQRQKDEQLYRLLGVGKSFDGACSDLLKMSHWTSTSQRVVRHPPAYLQNRKQRLSSPRE